jgi:hypothetical protein
MKSTTRINRSKRRDGVVLVLIVLILVTMMTFVALAIDLGMLAVARTQCQDAADSAAMAGARALNGNSSNNNNYANATPAALAAATGNSVLSTSIQSSQVGIDIGRYVYVPGNLRFEGQFPGPSTENWSMARATVSTAIGTQLPFSRVFNFAGVNLQAVATAAHRPRDVAIILDFSGSMRYASLLGEPTSGTRTSNNPDSVYPTFGHYSATSTAALQETSFTSPNDPANITTMTSDGRGPVIEDFYTDAGGTRAFYPASSGYSAVPGGDNYLRSNNNNAGSAYASTVGQVLNIASPSTSTPKHAFETSGGYDYTTLTNVPDFVGYTTGPGYWGKTFFVWPPDPRDAWDWRERYFTYPGSTTGADNSRLWTSTGSWRSPSSTTYAINYTAILNFIKNVGPNPFPSRLQSGRILYYDAIPDSISATYPPSDLNERFWKDYIDYCLGLVQTGSSSWLIINSATAGLAGYGTDYTWGTVRITANSSLTANPKPYMHYGDNPRRPRTHFWFGPMSMIDFLGNYNLWNQVSPANSRFCWWPGTCHEAPMYACKLGIRAALTDVETNHPNDLVSLIYFSAPSASSSGGGRFNRPRVGLSRAYTNMQEALWYPPATIGNASATVGPYDSNNLEVPRAMGSTCYAMGLMLAYNQFSANSTLVSYNPGAPAGDAGGMGRRGAQKIIIFETDGAPNTTATATLNNLGTANSYYRIRYNSASPGSSEFPTGVSSYSDNSSTVTTPLFNLCTQIAALDTASPPGHSTPSKPALIHCIGFGPVFAPGASSAAAATNTLNQMQIRGNVTDNMPAYKITYGNESTIVANLQTAFTQIMQSGVQISLIQ